ncbi:MAG: hypothetical protein K0B15_11815 [Lentimicrobium sp.]|nr:hypothetical protein [Lentimicrobium sp.]
MNGNPDLNKTIDAWSTFVLERWHKKISMLQIGYSQQLEDSLSRELFAQSAGDAAKVTFSFHYYGKFSDMGVGKGVDLGSVSSLKSDRALGGNETGNRRRPKKWYSPVFYTEVAKLKFILAKNYAHSGALAITETISDTSLSFNSNP